MSDRFSIGKAIRDARMARGWTQETLAEKAGTTQQTVARVERGETIHSRCVPALRQALGVDVVPAGQRNWLVYAGSEETAVPAHQLRFEAGALVFLDSEGGVTCCFAPGSWSQVLESSPSNAVDGREDAGQ